MRRLLVLVSLLLDCVAGVLDLLARVFRRVLRGVSRLVGAFLHLVRGIVDLGHVASPPSVGFTSPRIVAARLAPKSIAPLVACTAAREIAAQVVVAAHPY